RVWPTRTADDVRFSDKETVKAFAARLKVTEPALRSANPELAEVESGDLLSQELKSKKTLRVHKIFPAQMAYFSPRVPRTLILEEIKS
ncbi:hypothetical protein ACFL5Q_04195, partial [Planctomycetota bacterium]